MFNNSLTNGMINSWWKQCCFTASQVYRLFQITISLFVSDMGFFKRLLSWQCLYFCGPNWVKFVLGFSFFVTLFIWGVFFHSMAVVTGRIIKDIAWSYRAFLSIYSSKVKISYSDLWEVIFKNEIYWRFILYPSYVRCKKEMKHLVSTSVRV